MEFLDERLRTELVRFTRTAQHVVLWLQPDGGQGRARRNARRGLSEDEQRREQRVEADRAVEVALIAQRIERQVLQELTPSQRRAVVAV